MTIKNKISVIFNVWFAFTVGLFILDTSAGFEIKNQVLKQIVYWGFILGSPIILIVNLITFKRIKLKLITSILPIISMALILIVNPFKIILYSTAWCTQTIIYENEHLNFDKIEFQMQDIGAFGYNQRTVRAIYLTNLFMIVKTIPENIDDRIEWKKINEDVNELGIKYP